jgi:hypothetical protein
MYCKLVKSIAKAEGKVASMNRDAFDLLLQQTDDMMRK